MKKILNIFYKRYFVHNIAKKCRASVCSNLSFIHNPENGDTVVNFENYQSLNLSYVEMMGVFEKAEAKVDIFGYEVGVFGSAETEMAVGLGYSSDISIGATLTLNSSFTAGEYFLWFEYYTIATVSVKYLVKNNKEYFCKAEFNSNSPLDYANARLILKKPSYKFEEDAIC